MDSRRTAPDRLTPEATEFVRFCYRRRPVGWPELYDEMCAVAGRGLYQGWGPSELAEQGIGFSLFETSALAALVSRVVAEEQPSRQRPRPFVGPPKPAMPTEAEGRENRSIEIRAKLAGAAAG
jgi:hypothetical protein